VSIVKRLYFFRPNLKNHFYLYYSWIEAANKAGVDVTMFTVMSIKQKNIQLGYFNEVAQLNGVNIIVTPHERLNTIYTFFYLLISVVKYGQVSLIAKKVNLLPLNLIKKIVKKRFRYVIEIEGDAVSERDYLSKHPYKDGFYDDYLISAAKSIEGIPKRLMQADGVLVLSQGFKKVLLQRNPFLKPEQIQVISTGFIKGRFSYNEEKRSRFRDRLAIGNETVFIYAGNLYYSWQNMKKTLELFAYYLANIDNTAKFLILTHQSDQYIALGFIDELGISRESIILKEVPNSEIANYYNVADVCLLLRGNDFMNQVSSPGKIGEYAASGTPILTSSYIGDYSSLFKCQHLVEQVNDISDVAGMADKIQVLLTATADEKIILSNWSNEQLSSENNVASFIEAFNI
jgi:glycosyltransferase involved in cell wall biosynthesis